MTEHTLIKNPNSLVQGTNNPCRIIKKDQNQTAKLLEEDAKNKVNNKIKPTTTLHGPRHDIFLCKAIYAQAKYMKATWSYASIGGGNS